MIRLARRIAAVLFWVAFLLTLIPAITFSALAAAWLLLALSAQPHAYQPRRGSRLSWLKHGLSLLRRKPAAAESTSPASQQRHRYAVEAGSGAGSMQDTGQAVPESRAVRFAQSVNGRRVPYALRSYEEHEC